MEEKPVGRHQSFHFYTWARQAIYGPFLLVVSKNYSTTQDLRSPFPVKDEYVGAGIEDGLDIVLDLTADLEQIDTKSSNKR